MLNPKETDNFYIQGDREAYTQGSEFNVESILDAPSEELDGIEILVQMAKQGKLDPWNIDIADIHASSCTK